MLEDERILAIIGKDEEQDPALVADAKAIFSDYERTAMREMILNEDVRLDGRTTTEVRPIEIELGVLPSAHGSAIFQRGETQGLVVCTLGSKADEQRYESLQGEGSKSYMLHYNFPPYCVGECKRLGMSRREIGHGHLAERSLAAVLPLPEDFPYTIRVVSEIQESNGSSSMASVCGGCLSLMDAGVPIKAPVAGVAMGLISEKGSVKEGGKIKILTDITGTEDHLGDMDFKVTGTAEGITAFQMDIKIRGITPELMREALEQARQGRLHILGKMAELGLAAPRPKVSEKAPTMIKMRIPTNKIRDVIGSGGSVIKGMQSQTGCTINIDDDGNIDIAAPSGKAAAVCRRMIEELTAEPEPGRKYKGKVKTIQPFGAFVEILPGRDGLVHISELADHRVDKVEDVVHVGDEVEVLCLGVDPKGKVKLSMMPLDVTTMISMMAGEYSEKLTSKKIDLDLEGTGEGAVMIKADPDQLGRVFSNLFSNMYKYSMPGTRAYIDVRQPDGKVEIAFLNISEAKLHITAQELTERFVRGDIARSTEGSGLGLSIARGLTELMNGTFEVIIEGDLFKVKVTFPAA